MPTRTLPTAHRSALCALTLCAACSPPVVTGDASRDNGPATDTRADAAGSELGDVVLIDTSVATDAAADDTRSDIGGGDSPSMDAVAFDAATMDSRSDVAVVDVGASDVRPADARPPGPRSVFFPTGWRPLHAGGTADAMGRALPDFAYSGYHSGIAPPPYGMGTVVATVSATVGDGRTDATSTIQRAIDSACTMGGGVVLIPAGTYRLTFPSTTARAAIEIRCRAVVLRGAGRTTTRLWLDDPTRARDRAIVSFRGAGTLFDSTTTTRYALTADALRPTTNLVTAATGTLAVGDYIAIRQDNSAAFRTEHRMDPTSSGLSGLWPTTGYNGVTYARRITTLAGGRIGLDAPTHYPLKTRDNARVYAIGAFIDEVGLESLSVGMTQNNTSPITEPGSEDEYGTAGTSAYEVHGSRAIEFDRVHDGWVYDVATFRPTVNTSEVHVLSSALLLSSQSFRMTVASCSFAFPQYRGGGGNGYLVHVQGSDALVRDSRTERARHGFILNNAASGTVFLRDTVVNSRYSDDSHRFLAHANLYDNVQLDRAWLQSVNRGTTSTGAGFTATQHVFWNTRVIANHASARGCAIESAQWGYGYLLGATAATGATAMLCPMSFSNSTWAALDQGAPTDFVEAAGVVLDPPSLYEAQLAIRCARESLTCR